MKSIQVSTLTKGIYALTKSVLRLIAQIKILIPILITLICLLQSGGCNATGFDTLSISELDHQVSWQPEGPEQIQWEISGLGEDSTKVCFLALELTIPPILPDDSQFSLALISGEDGLLPIGSYQYSVETYANRLVILVHFGAEGLLWEGSLSGTVSGLIPTEGSSDTQQEIAITGGLIIVENIDAF